jgi:hypothetical protein
MNSIQTLLESSNQYKVVMDDAKKLSQKWSKSGLLEGIKSESDRNTMAVLLENQAKQLVTEASNTGGTASQSGGGYNSENWAGVALPLVRRVFGEIAAKEFVSVQPMNLPSGLVFYLDFKYGTGINPFKVGDSLYSADPNTNVTDLVNTASLYGAGKFGYSINQFSASINSITSSTTWADFNFDAEYSASSINGTYRKVSVPLGTISNGDFNAVRAWTIQSSSFASTNTLQAFTTVNTAQTTASFIIPASIIAASGAVAGVMNGVQLNYEKQPTPAARGDFEDAAGAGYLSGNNNIASPAVSNAIAIPEINVQLKSEAIVAKTRKLKAQWTPEFAQDLNAYHSVDAEAELTGILSQYISMEIDLELLDMLIQNAYTVEAWSAVNNTAMTVTNNSISGATPTPLTSGYYNTQGGWFQTLGTKLQKVSNKIHQLTLRGGANFLVMSPTVATILESIPGFASDGDGEKQEFNFGIQKIGSLNSRYKVYKNPYMTENVILMGYKGSQFLECGAVFAPYVPLIMTPLLYDPNTFTPRKGLMTRYAKKMIRPDYYGKIYVSGLNTI